LRARRDCNLRGTKQARFLILSDVLDREGIHTISAPPALHRSFALPTMTKHFLDETVSRRTVILIHDSSGGAAFSVKVHPHAKKNAVTGQLGDALKVSLTAPPTNGRANEACIEFFAKLLEVPQSSVTIASGRNKVVRVKGLTPTQVHERLR